MIVELTETERFIENNDPWFNWERVLAWRAFGKALGVHVDDPIMIIDGDGSQFEPITKRYFHLKKAEDKRFLSLGEFGCWDYGAMRSLSPRCTYVSYNMKPDRSCAIFHGWYRPKERSRIILRDPDSPIPFLEKDGLLPMDRLIDRLKQKISQVGGGES